MKSDVEEETKTGPFDPAEFEDRYETAVAAMLKQKQAGLPPTKEAPAAPPSTVVNLMDALRQSLKGKPAAKHTSHPRSPTARRSSSAKKPHRSAARQRKAS